MTTAQHLPNESPIAQGAGRLDVERATRAPTPVYRQMWAPSVGTGSLELARGSIHVADDSGDLTGERDIFGVVWDGPTWALASLAETAWNGGTWRGETWSGQCWCGSSSAGDAWERSSWRETNWSRSSWRTTGWTRSSWRGAVWSTAGWE